MLNPPSDSKNAVLIVDDSKDDIELLKRAFINAGVKNSLIIESTGEAALSHFAPGGHAPCIALVDLRMPGMDGFEVIRTIARNPTHKSVLLVAITPYDLHAIRKAYECGAHCESGRRPQLNAFLFVCSAQT